MIFDTNYRLIRVTEWPRDTFDLHFGAPGHKERSEPLEFTVRMNRHDFERLHARADELLGEGCKQLAAFDRDDTEAK